MNRIRKATVITAIKTPYLKDGKIDLKCFDQLVEYQIKQGVSGLVIGGTTGEGHLMNWDEHIMLIAHSVVNYSKELVIIGNTGSNNTREASKATEQGFAVGMDASLQVNPYYGKTTDAGLLAHFDRVLELGPGIIYNVPGRTGQDLLPQVIEKLSKNLNFVGIKECAGSERILNYETMGIHCWSGDDSTCHDSRHRCNSRGVISVASNILPGIVVKLMQQQNDVLDQQLQPFFTWLGSVPNPIPVNTMLMMLGRVKPVFRLPYYPMEKEQQEEGKKIIEALQKLESETLLTRIISLESFFIV